MTLSEKIRRADELLTELQSLPELAAESADRDLAADNWTMITGVRYLPVPHIARKLAHNTGSVLQRSRVLGELQRCPQRWWWSRELAMELGGMSTHTAHQRCLELVAEGLATERFSGGRCEFRVVVS